MPLYQFISAPADNTKQLTLQKLKEKIASMNADFSEVFPIQVPDFKIGTLDSLIQISDELAKLDTAAESATSKIADNLRTLLEGQVSAEQMRSYFMVNDRSVDVFVKALQWNTIKYRTDRQIKDLHDNLAQEVQSIEQMIRNKMAAYNQVKSTLASVERKQTGNLSVKSLVNIVKKEHLVLDSEFMQSVIVAVPRQQYQEFYNKYESLTNMVVPRSCQKIAEDDEFGLFSVVVFQKVLDSYISKLRDEKFTPRDFVWDEAALSNAKKEMADLGAQSKDQWSSLVRLCKTNFGEVFAAWMHVKLLRVYVESILRYGLPPDFQVMLVKPKAKQERRIRDLLQQHYNHLANPFESKNTQKQEQQQQQQMDEIQGLIFERDYRPYVNFEFTWDQ